MVGGRKWWHGRAELAESDHSDTIHVATVQCKASIHTLDEYRAVKAKGHEPLEWVATPLPPRRRASVR